MKKTLICTLILLIFNCLHVFAQCKPLIKNIDIISARCYGSSDGQFIVYNTPEARQPIIYTLKDSLGRDAALLSGNPVFSRLPANNYKIILHDSIGCSDSAIVKITQPNRRVFEFVTLQCDDGSGNGRGKLLDKDTGKAYTWSGNNSDSIFTKLKSSVTTNVTISDAGACFQVVSLNVKKCVSASIDNIDFSLKIFPNPFSENLTIESAGIMERIEVADILGRTIVVQKINNVQAILPLSILTKGVYVLRIFTEKGTVLRKIMKE
jgi:hypothetical protein